MHESIQVAVLAPVPLIREGACLPFISEPDVHPSNLPVHTVIPLSDESRDLIHNNAVIRCVCPGRVRSDGCAGRQP